MLPPIVLHKSDVNIVPIKEPKPDEESASDLYFCASKDASACSFIIAKSLIRFLSFSADVQAHSILSEAVCHKLL